ncbi:TetR/AcrR family transcriptional regulator [Spirilliplanes yamanashiensis]|uniref:TetR family transcriptional regulator n=1 Tax=Spirilliplanes yamanashiensis TaxID=42233 RepID=A0A8J3Y8L3_9ACTN|nr:TetR/AcrR family transcriptional regulator [Spirilliplanes yamanashiensis]MDP9816933.1 AcrR family transcriptional regulator [Spirilliplanes yamanashiensis]GIJ03412.1 TetR family transcriptional regulator [Spirilliplanes yamanashiensis]
MTAAPPAGAPRAEQVRATRHRVLTAARDLFLRRGYAGTTIEAVAHRAKVSPQTVYNVVGGKAALLKTVYDVLLAGDDEPVPMIERPAFRAMLAATDGRDCLTRYAAIGGGMYRRVGPLVPVVYAGGPDPALRAFADTVEGERARGTAAMAAHVAGRFGLRPGLSVAEAADVLWALTAPELADRFVRRRGWSLQRYEEWLATTMADALLPPAAPVSGSRATAG